MGQALFSIKVEFFAIILKFVTIILRGKQHTLTLTINHLIESKVKCKEKTYDKLWQGKGTKRTSQTK